MKQISILGSSVCVAVLATACGSNGLGTSNDAGTHPDARIDAHPVDSGQDKDTGCPLCRMAVDSGHDAGKPDAGKAQYVLVTGQGSSSSELVAVALNGTTVAGSSSVGDTQAILDTHDPTTAFMLGQTTDTVWRLDATQPWKLDSSFSVGITGEKDAGIGYSDPYEVVLGEPGSAYVLRYTSNYIDLIPYTLDEDAGAPSHKIDLSGLLQAGDHDTIVEAVGGAFVAATHTLYVVLGNIDRTTILPPSYDLLCTTTVSTVIAIDTQHNVVKSLGDAGPGGSVALKGFDPVYGGVVFDEANHRILIEEAGCTPATGDAGGGGTIKHGIEAFDLTTNTTTLLLPNFTAPTDFPSELVLVGNNKAVVQVNFTGSETYGWDMTTSALGAAIATAPDVFAYDGNGNLVGVNATPVDGGMNSQIVSVALATGTSTTLVSQPFSIPIAFVGGAGVWPHP